MHMSLHTPSSHAPSTPHGISRRTFHKLMMGVVGASAVARPVSSGQPSPRVFDVLVVGAGVSGVYTGWRLITTRSGRRLDVCILEASERVGGRLYSVASPEAPELHAELGGMRFLETQESVAGLAHHLGLEIVPFLMGGPQNLNHLRGVHLQISDYESAPAGVPYNLLAAERGQVPFQLLVATILGAFPALASLSVDQAREYLKTATVDGQLVWQTGFWNFLARQLSVEGYNLIRDAGGYFSIVSNWNLYDAIPFILEDFASPSYQKLAAGFQSLPQTLAEEFVENGGVLRLGTQATALAWGGGQGSIRVSVREPGSSSPTVYEARHVVLALPRRAIELLDPGSFIFTEQFKADLTTVRPERAAKLFLWYDEEWWTPLGLTSGPSITDQPLRQCYYFGTEPGSAGRRGAGLLLATYHDSGAVSFWNGYFPFSAHDQSSPPFANRDRFIEPLAPPQALIEELTRQLSVLHQIEVPPPHTALYRDWTVDPYGAGWHFWNPHNRSWEVIPRIRRPVPAANLYVCGEAYSANQGWVEGAINSAERVLQGFFGLSRPAWVSPTYDFGP